MPPSWSIAMTGVRPAAGADVGGQAPDLRGRAHVPGPPVSLVAVEQDHAAEPVAERPGDPAPVLEGRAPEAHDEQARGRAASRETGAGSREEPWGSRPAGWASRRVRRRRCGAGRASGRRGTAGRSRRRGRRAGRRDEREPARERRPEQRARRDRRRALGGSHRAGGASRHSTPVGARGWGPGRHTVRRLRFVHNCG